MGSAVLTVISAIGAGIYKIATNTTIVEKAMKDFNEESSREIANAKVFSCNQTIN